MQNAKSGIKFRLGGIDIGTERKTMNYIPSKIKIGLVQNVKDERLQGTSIISCMDAGRRWLNTANFRNLVGYLPSETKNRHTEMMKTVSGSVGEEKNEPVSGFVLLSAYRSLADLSSTAAVPKDLRFKGRSFITGCVKLRDPRGFEVIVSAADMMKNLLENGLSVDSEGRLEGTFVWGVEIPDDRKEEPFFRLFETSSEEYAGSMKESEADAARRRISWIPASELEDGVIYGRSSSKDPYSANYTRVLYLGRRNLLPHKLVKGVLDHHLYSDYLKPRGRYWPKPQEAILKKLIGADMRREMCGNREFPWEREEWISFCRLFETCMAQTQNNHVFAVLKPDRYSYIDEQHELRFGEEEDQRLDWMTHIEISSEIKEQNIRIRAEDQRTVVVNCNGEIENGEEFREGLLAGLEAFNTRFITAMQEAMENFPPEKPSDISSYILRLRRLG